jgi:hypothetical protein
MAMMAAVEEYDWEGFGKGLVDVVKPFHVELLKLAYGEASRALPVEVAFNQKNANVKKTLASLGKQVQGVSDTVRARVVGIVDKGLDAGSSTKEIAKALRESGVTDSASRSQLIARTETATAYNKGAVLSYSEAKVKRVKVLDGDGDDICAEVDGTEQTLEWADENPIGHPGCTRAFVPVVD